MTIRGIIFDFGGVFSPQHESLAGFTAAAKRFGRSEQELYDLLYSGEEWRLARTGRLRAEEYWRRMMGLLGLQPDGDVQSFLAELFSGEAIDPQVVRIATLLGQRYPLALLSNALDDLEILLVEKYRLRHLFAAVINSAAVGVAKPDPQAYELALQALGLSPSEALFIDDKQRNVQAALTLGIPSIRYTTPQALTAELLARCLLDEQEIASLGDSNGVQALG
ncbi:MAG: haloacid dehalogenase [Herpetosiphonaceae bacterium]|nr:MAG: haloacid dehalogenase [Herpetosiphonaceae bacterium]